MQTPRRPPVTRRALSGNERGMILATILLMLPVVALLGAVAITITTTDVEISGNYKATVRAVAAAEAGLEEARAQLIGSSADAACYCPLALLAAYGSSAGSGSTLQIEWVHDPGPPLPAVIYATANFAGHGSSMTISGLDRCGVAPAVGSGYTLAPGTTCLS